MNGLLQLCTLSLCVLVVIHESECSNWLSRYWNNYRHRYGYGYYHGYLPAYYYGQRRYYGNKPGSSYGSGKRPVVQGPGYNHVHSQVYQHQSYPGQRTYQGYPGYWYEPGVPSYKPSWGRSYARPAGASAPIPATKPATSHKIVAQGPPKTTRWHSSEEINSNQTPPGGHSLYNSNQTPGDHSHHDSNHAPGGRSRHDSNQTPGDNSHHYSNQTPGDNSHHYSNQTPGDRSHIYKTPARKPNNYWSSESRNSRQSQESREDRSLNSWESNERWQRRNNP